MQFCVGLRTLSLWIHSKILTYNALNQSYFYHCSPLWDNCGKQRLDKFQKFQNRAARIIAGANNEINSTDVLESLGWVTLERRRQKMKSLLLYKIWINYTAANLKESLIRSSSMPVNCPLASQRRGAPYRAQARGEGTNSDRLFTPGKTEVLASLKFINDRGRGCPFMVNNYFKN